MFPVDHGISEMNHVSEFRNLRFVSTDQFKDVFYLHWEYYENLLALCGTHPVFTLCHSAADIDKNDKDKWQFLHSWMKPQMFENLSLMVANVLSFKTHWFNRFSEVQDQGLGDSCHTWESASKLQQRFPVTTNFYHSYRSNIDFINKQRYCAQRTQVIEDFEHGNCKLIGSTSTISHVLFNGSSFCVCTKSTILMSKNNIFL